MLNLNNSTGKGENLSLSNATAPRPQAEPAIMVAGIAPPAVLVADGPLSEEGVVLSKLSLAELEAKFGYQHTESLHGDKEKMEAVLYENMSSMMYMVVLTGDGDEYTEAVKERLKAPLDGLVICDLGPEVGQGLFTSEAISHGTVICLYMGEVVNTRAVEAGTVLDQAPPHYGHAWVKHPKLGAKEIDAGRIGGIARFIQHLPDSEEGLDDHGLATENIKRLFVRVEGIPVLALIAGRDISAGEQLGFDYGENYWKIRGEKPRYFTPAGKLI